MNEIRAGHQLEQIIRTEVDQDPGEFFSAVCECGAISPRRESEAQARSDWAQHVQQISEG